MSFLRETAGWTLAAGLTAAAHVGVAHWALSGSPPSMPAPAAVMVDLVAAPTEPAPVPPQPTQPQAADAPADPSPPEPAPVPEPETTPQDSAAPLVVPAFQRLEPLTDLAAFVAPPTAIKLPAPAILPPVGDFAALIAPAPALTASAPPVPRPARRQADPAREARPAASEPAAISRRESRQTTAKAAAGADKPTESVRRAANDASGTAQSAPGAAPTGAASPQALQRWHARVGAQITRHMSRTRVNGGQAQVRIAVTVSPNGAAAGRLAASSGDPRIDAALSRQAGRLPRMQPPPSGRAESFVLPIRITR
ncbi:TonB C-terminal domain-containing protein [uncultured Paracoccus sp.]|uniref:TonB C-terminal domain-containing protein n=1 Tax=uncultured Paracoccus sp. TaxID=189685 RepID=UPI00261972E8|nr:TonB C-terminal domain-containing protein [uncultured Paracoccus sp.]